MRPSFKSTLLSAVLFACATPLASKTIGFTGTLDFYNYEGPDTPFSDTPGFIDVFIEVEEVAAPDIVNDSGIGQTGTYLTAVQSFSYEIFDVVGDKLGQWSAFDVQLQMANYVLGDGVQLFSNAISGPDPFNRMQMLLEGGADSWSSLSLDELTQDTLRAMPTGWLDINLMIGESTFGARFAITSESIVVTDPPGPRPSPVPLPAGLPLLVAGLGALALVGRARRFTGRFHL
ncbi:VPLPA-CTERM sorting domain-containing protein [Roseobacter sinensis]|uniref:VPLPA-CTERM sorting domain-containing protein n=1 Tax=Roseobacter sinensis TaxID=2931391 RepID=A0ABT3BA71_9RHOB|nr:VPLPA-CTERM sorting domain-containing protein [Roseobacter sp. WL0113]MCV3270478.1 VPLPA-CTERM sorting domain-containing protein [Roseobacter sp. WL0113]